MMPLLKKLILYLISFTSHVNAMHDTLAPHDPGDELDLALINPRPGVKYFSGEFIIYSDVSI